MRRTERFTAILRALESEGSIDVGELSLRLKVSAATLRRDLALLEEERLLARTHGGATPSGTPFPLPTGNRDERWDVRRSIARAAADRVPEGPQVVALTAGVVTPVVARLLADRDGLTVVTNAVDIAAELVLRPRLRVVVTGGTARPQSAALTGPWAEGVLRDVSISVALVEADAVAVGGWTTHDEVEARTLRAVVERAERTIVIIEGPQLGRVLLARVVSLDLVDDVITDEAADPAQVERLREAGITVSVAANHGAHRPAGTA